MRFEVTVLMLGALILGAPAAHAAPVATACGEYYAEDGSHYEDDLTVHDDGTLTSTDGDALDVDDDLLGAIVALATDLSDADLDGGGYVHASSSDGTVEAGTDQVLWDADGDGLPDPDPEGRVSCN